MRLEWNTGKAAEALREKVDQTLKAKANRLKGRVESNMANMVGKKTGYFHSHGPKVLKSKYRNGGYIVYIKSPHAHLIEYGTGPRYHKSGKHVGRGPAIPFFRQALRG